MEPEGCPISNILEVLRLFQRMILQEMNEEITKEISEEEVNHLLHSFQKGESTGLDGFTLEFYLGFYDCIKEDILKLVKESQKSRKVLGMINSKKNSLIPKNKKYDSFNDFLPISCCNMIYKVIEKVTFLMLKPILSEIITKNSSEFYSTRKSMM